jgi:hypothetical protein
MQAMIAEAVARRSRGIGHVTGTEDRKEHQKQSKPSRETIPDLAFHIEIG